MLLALSLAAFGHPFGGDYRGGAGEPGMGVVGQRLEVRVNPAEVDVTYIAEVPAARVYREAKEEAGGADWSRKYLERLRTGIRARWRGAALALEPVEVADAARTGEANFVEFHVRGRAAIPEGAGRLQVSNGNFPDEPAYFATNVHLSGSLVATQASLVEVADGRLKNNRHGAWTRDEAARELSVEVRPARFWQRADGASPLPARMEGMLPKPRWWLAISAILPLLMLALWWRRR